MFAVLPVSALGYEGKIEKKKFELNAFLFPLNQISTSRLSQEAPVTALP
jgi:hypothetical protein